MRLGSVVLHRRMHFCTVGLWQESEDYLLFCAQMENSTVAGGAPPALGKMWSWSHLSMGTMINLVNSVPDPSYTSCLRTSSGHHSNVACRKSDRCRKWQISEPQRVSFEIGWEWFYGKLLLNHSVLRSFSQSSAGTCKMIHDVSLLP